MQIHFVGHRGQAKPFPSIPRINWAHPLTAKLISYCYDTGSGPIDLVTGKNTILNNRNNPPLVGIRPSQYGSGLLSAAAVTSVTGGAYFVSGNSALNTTIVAAPYSYGCGIMMTVAPTTFITMFSLCNTSTTNKLEIGLANTAADFWWRINNGTISATAAGFYRVGSFQSLLGVASTGSTSNCYVDGVLRISPAVTTTSAVIPSPIVNQTFNGLLNLASTSTMAGFFYYGAVWKGRALNANEARLLHDDPYCFLIYPEDEMFASMVGVTTAPFQWYPMNDIGLPELPIIRPPLDIIGY